MEDTLQAELVAPKRSDGFFEELFGVLVSSVDTANINLLPLNRHIVGFEDSFDGFRDFSTNTITYETRFKALVDWAKESTRSSEMFGAEEDNEAYLG